MAGEQDVAVDTRVVPTEAGGTGTPPPSAPPPSSTPDAPAAAPAPAAAAAAPAAPVAPAKPVVGSGTEDKPALPGAFGDDWRQKMGADDEKKIGRLSKYASPQAVADALIAAQDLIARGGHKKGIGKDSTPEEVKAYREQLGIPEKGDGYKLEMDVPEEAKGVVGDFLNSAVEMNLTPDQVNKTVGAFLESQQRMEEARHEEDLRIKDEVEEQLRTEWGGEFKRNLNLINNLLGDIGENLLLGRMADGTPVGSSPAVLRTLLGLALERNPVGVIVPQGDGSMEASVEGEISKIEKLMRENRKEYNRDEKLQARYRQLLDWRVQNQGRKVA